MDALLDIANRAISDYGFRQVVVWSPDDVVAQWGLAPPEADCLRGPLVEALEALPVPVEPEDIPMELDRMAQLIADALRPGRGK